MQNGKIKTQSALAAKMIKGILKKEFPGVKFSVTSENFSMGDAVRVNYTDAMPVDIVESKIKQFQYGHFNGMEDLYEHSSRRNDIPQTKFLSVDRSLSIHVREKLTAEINKRYKVNCEYNDLCVEIGEYMYTLVYREAQNRTF